MIIDTFELHADDIRWTLAPSNPLTRCDDDWRVEALWFRELFLLAAERLYVQTKQLEAARQTIREQRDRVRDLQERSAG
jgi:hypothetical protein